MTENVKVTVLRAELKEYVVRPVPLVDYFFDDILMVIQLKPNRPLVCLPPRITLNAHSDIVAQMVGIFHQ